MRRLVMSAFVALGAMSVSEVAHATLYIQYYRDNLFFGLAYHRVGCLTNWRTILDNQDYQGFTSKRYCYSGRSSASVPDGQIFSWDYAASKSVADSCGRQTNTRYGTPNYARRSNTCNYNILFDCNSDCWIRYFGGCLDGVRSNGFPVPIESPCTRFIVSP